MNEMARYHLSVGGKCLRGLLALAEAESTSLPFEQAMTWATACELLHNATLIHDDIQDNDPIRRGQTSLWKKFGISQAINTGDLLIFRSFKLASQLNSPRLTQLLAATAETLVRGQVDELLQIQKGTHGYWESYLSMTEHKTGTLFKLPVHGVQILTDSPFSEIESQAWYSLGACYQIYDDIRDFFGLKQEGQKQKDFTEKRINALVAWLSKSEQYQSLIKDYLTIPGETQEGQDNLSQLATAIADAKVVEQLLAYTQNKLEFFKANTKLQTQTVVLQFFQSAMQKGVSSHVEARV